MPSAPHPASTRFDQRVLAELAMDGDQRLNSMQMYAKVSAIIRDSLRTGAISRTLASHIRLCIKLSPYSTEVPALLHIHRQVLKTFVEARMGHIAEIVRSCRERRIPVPVVISCEKYLGRSLPLRAALEERYFSIPPIVVRGDPALDEERYEASVLTLPVDDTYEGLPVKVLEVFALFQALDDRCSVLKIDDDLVVLDTGPLEEPRLVEAFSIGDYMGNVVFSPFHDRIFHMGKCTQPTSPVYGKAVKTPWARGALYYLSPHALNKLTSHYLRFPGCLDGEMYEDKAVADMLHDNGILVTGYAFEPLLGLDSARQEAPPLA